MYSIEIWVQLVQLWICKQKGVIKIQVCTYMYHVSYDNNYIKNKKKRKKGKCLV